MPELPIAYSEKTARILIVDDEPNIRQPLVRALNLSGYYTEEAESGMSALELLQQTRFDVMILDMQMPGMHGTLVMEQVRKIQPDLIILILTGHATVDSAIAAVKSHATDYLVKPTNLKEIMLAVTQALQQRKTDFDRQQLLHTALDALQRAEHLAAINSNEASIQLPPPHPDRFVRAGCVTMDRDKQLAIVTGPHAGTAKLTKGEATILEILLTHPEESWSCRELAHRAWNYELDELSAESMVRPYISRLRQKLEENPAKPTLIVTVRGRGYLLAL